MMQKGFDSEVFDSQAVFRNLLLAMANPGTIAATDINISCPERLQPGAGALLLTLLDFETVLWADLDPETPEMQWVHFYTGTRLTHAKNRAGFALLTDGEKLMDPGQFDPGTAASPDRSTTLVIQTRGMDQGPQLRLTGPGIEKETFIHLAGITTAFWDNRAMVNQAYPAGIDMVFVHAGRFAALPRTTKVTVC